MNIFITGANGFIGTELVKTLLSRGFKLTIISRKKNFSINQNVKQIIGSFSDEKLIDKHLINIECVIHLAAISNIMNENSLDAASKYLKTNYEDTKIFANLCAQKNIKRFIFLSSVKVNGETTEKYQPFNSNSPYRPSGNYAISKQKAEQELLRISSIADMSVVIIRPPIVYGPNVKGNFNTLISIMKKGIPLPFGSIYNSRSFLALDNLIDFIILCTNHSRTPSASNEIFHISDGHDISTTELLKEIAAAYKLTCRIFPFPVFLLRFILKIIRKNSVSERLFENLQVSSDKAKTILGWSPVINMKKQLEIMSQNEK